MAEKKIVEQKEETSEERRNRLRKLRLEFTRDGGFDALPPDMQTDIQPMYGDGMD